LGDRTAGARAAKQEEIDEFHNTARADPRASSGDGYAKAGTARRTASKRSAMSCQFQTLQTASKKSTFLF
jgi:hypothetical protein